MSSRIYHKHGDSEGPQGEDISWLLSPPHWGFLIYRCDYRSDAAWNTFINNWSRRVKAYLTSQYSTTEFADKLLFTVQNDRASLNNASIEQVHKLFSTWIRSDEAYAERKVSGYGHISFPRYTYCVRVDAQALDSCLEWFARTREYADPWMMSEEYDCESGKKAYVNIVRAEEELYFTPELEEEVREVFPEDEEFEDDGEEDKGPVAVKMELWCVVPAVYTRIFLITDPGRWDCFHRDGTNICSI
ncbi:hypothetical protein T440DRAFT_506634 [Plenodomus tracheiphilus IPT5]|uniref:Uncharacterized protein n=1 Tax=Plenodomus tracheiphilus IPT5 TaxID=1408161 RepID=A0A6A7BAE6_9PLEO|nr:hypothetical protein T440DRAFT_506634 [Plenodomus tracheiphilus IPT5]